jgi:hypothetical protein
VGDLEALEAVAALGLATDNVELCTAGVGSVAPLASTTRTSKV